MKIVALLATKGGVGKSTLALYFAVEAERTGNGPVVVIDLDPHKSATYWYHKRESDQTIEPDHTIRVMPSNRNIDRVLELCRKAGVGLVLIDTAPNALTEAAAAASAADLIVIPTRAGVFDIEAIDQTVEVVQRARGLRYWMSDSHRPSGDADNTAMIVLNAVRPSGPQTNEAREALKVYGLPICPTAIVQRAALADALIDGRGVQELDPRGKAATEIADVWLWIKGQM